ncbi:MAG: phosphoribosyl-ATP diphosphatase, partial [Rhodospirillaceae bacterium]|nr:phosphoribosyl-ATP diphosphatase [Rhodospirillaceae bacterium]
QDGSIVEELYGVIEKRKGGDPETSYVARTFARGREHVAKKVGEEGVEVALAGALGDKKGLVSESADLLFHLLVLWSAAGVKPADVFVELSKRRGVSGLAREAGKRKAGDKR